MVYTMCKNNIFLYFYTFLIYLQVSFLAHDNVSVSILIVSTAFEIFL